MLHEGEELYVALSWDDEAPVPTTSRTPTRQLKATTRFWRHWLAAAPEFPTTRSRPLIQRSALAIKGLTYMPTGATVAALTTSLPETPGGERNWDYRYTWMRDSTFTLQALHFLDLDWEADEFMQFIADLEPNDDGGLQIMYGIDGRRDLTEELREDLTGYDGAQPRADRQRRVRSAPERRIRRRARLGAAAHSPQPAAAAPAVAARPGAGRVRQGRVAAARPGHLGGARQAAALRLIEADVLGRDGSGGEARGRSAARTRLAAEWAAVAEEIKADILEHGVDKRGVLRQHYDTERSMPRRCWRRSSGSCPGTTSACARVVLAIADELTEHGFVLRYRTDETDDGLSGKEGTFVICSFWLVSALAIVGEMQRARDLMDASDQGRRRRSGCTPRSSTWTPAGISGTSRRRSRTSRWSRPRPASSSPSV